MENKEKIYELINQIKLIRRVINYGYDKALLYADIGAEEEFTESLKDKTKDELLELSNNLKIQIDNNSRRKENIKRCIGMCKSEFIEKDDLIQVYCPSCDRIKATRPKETKFKDIE